MNWIKERIEKFKIKEYQKDLINRRECCIQNLLIGIETEESIEMFNEIKILFNKELERRLSKNSKEKTNIEKFLCKKRKR